MEYKNVGSTRVERNSSGKKNPDFTFSHHNRHTFLLYCNTLYEFSYHFAFLLFTGASSVSLFACICVNVSYFCVWHCFEAEVGEQGGNI